MILTYNDDSIHQTNGTEERRVNSEIRPDQLRIKKDFWDEKRSESRCRYQQSPKPASTFVHWETLVWAQRRVRPSKVYITKENGKGSERK